MKVINHFKGKNNNCLIEKEKDAGTEQMKIKAVVCCHKRILTGELHFFELHFPLLVSPANQLPSPWLEI